MAGPGANAPDSVQHSFTLWVQDQRQRAARLGTLAFVPTNQAPRQHPVHENAQQFGPTPPNSRPNSFPSSYQQTAAQAIGPGHLVRDFQPSPASREHHPVHQYHHPVHQYHLPVHQYHLPVHQYIQQSRHTPPEPALVPLPTSYQQVSIQAIGPGYIVRDSQLNLTPQQHLPVHRQHQLSGFTPSGPVSFPLPTSYQQASTQATGSTPSRRYPRIDRSGGIPCLNPDAAYLGPDPVNSSQYLQPGGGLPSYRNLLHNTRQPIPNESSLLTNQPIPPQSAFLERRPARVEQPAHFGRPRTIYEPLSSQEPIPERRPARVEPPADFGRRVLAYKSLLSRGPSLYRRSAHAEPAPQSVVLDRGLDLDEVDRKLALYQQTLGVEQPPLTSEPLPPHQPVPGQQHSKNEPPVLPGNRLISFASAAPAATQQSVNTGQALAQERIPVEHGPGTRQQPIRLEDDPSPPYRRRKTHTPQTTHLETQRTRRGRLKPVRRALSFSEVFRDGAKRGPPRSDSEISPRGTKHSRPRSSSEGSPHNPNPGRRRSPSTPPPSSLPLDQLQVASSATDAKRSRPRSVTVSSPHNSKRGRRRSPSASSPSPLSLDPHQLASPVPEGRLQLGLPAPEGQLPKSSQNQLQPAPLVRQGEEPLQPPLPTRQSEHSPVPAHQHQPTPSSTPPSIPPRRLFRAQLTRPIRNTRNRQQPNIQPVPTQSISPPPQPILQPTQSLNPPNHPIPPLTQPAPYQAPESYLRTRILPQPEFTPPPAILLHSPESNLRTTILHQPEPAPPPTDSTPYQAPESNLCTPILPQPEPEPTPPAPMPPPARSAVPGVPDTDPFSPAQDHQARGHQPTVPPSPQANRRPVHTPASRAQAALAAVNNTRAQAALARGQAGVGTANLRGQATRLTGGMMRGGGEGRAGSGSGIGGSERRDSAGVEMPDSFAELQRREGCIAVTDSWERMAGVACRDCEVSGFLFLVFVALLGFPPLTPLLLRPLHLSIRLSRFLWYFWAGVKAEWVKEDEVGGSGETAMKGTGEAEVEVELVTEVTEAGVAGEVEAVVERSPSRSKLEECEIREGSEEGEIVESEPEECAVHQRGGWIGRGRLRRCRRGTERSIPQTRLRYRKKLVGVADRDDTWEDAFEVVWWDEEEVAVAGSSRADAARHDEGDGPRGAVFGSGFGSAGGSGGPRSAREGKGKGGAGARAGRENEAGGTGTGTGKGGRGSPKSEKKRSAGRRGGGAQREREREREAPVAGPSGTYARLREAQEGGRRR